MIKAYSRNSRLRKAILATASKEKNMFLFPAGAQDVSTWRGLTAPNPQVSPSVPGGEPVQTTLTSESQIAFETHPNTNSSEKSKSPISSKRKLIKIP